MNLPHYQPKDEDQVIVTFGGDGYNSYFYAELKDPNNTEFLWRTATRHSKPDVEVKWIRIYRHEKSEIK